MAALRMEMEEASDDLAQTCIFCERTFLVHGVLVRLHGVDTGEGPICPECLALGPEIVAGHLEKKAQKTTEEAEAVKRLAQEVAKMEGWKTAADVDQWRSIYAAQRAQPRRKRTTRG